MFHELKHNQHIWDSTLHFKSTKKSPKQLGRGHPLPYPQAIGPPPPLSIGALQFNSNDYMKGNKKTFRCTKYTRVNTVAPETLNRPPIAEKKLRKIGRRKVTQLGSIKTADAHLRNWLIFVKSIVHRC